VRSAGGATNNIKDEESKMFESLNNMQRELWAPLRPALEQIVDAVAATPVEAQLEHRLHIVPNLWREFVALFLQRHPAIYAAYEAAERARNKAANAAASEKAKQQGIAKRRATLAAKKATREAKRQAAQ
jgi:hypothetical protein